MSPHSPLHMTMDYFLEYAPAILHNMQVSVAHAIPSHRKRRVSHFFEVRNDCFDKIVSIHAQGVAVFVLSMQGYCVSIDATVV